MTPDSIRRRVRRTLARGLHHLPGRLAAVALVGALGVFSFADGLHSVHHLPDHDAASRCAVAAAAANVAGVVADPTPLLAPPLPLPVDLPDRVPGVPNLQPAWTAPGRAPPSTLS